MAANGLTYGACLGVLHYICHVQASIVSKAQNRSPWKSRANGAQLFKIDTPLTIPILYLPGNSLRPHEGFSATSGVLPVPLMVCM